jgi:ribonuclease Z
MSDFELILLGTSSSQPVNGRNLTSQLVHYGQSSFLIDCGEGTQMQLSKFKVKRNKIKVILISHLHGDHIFGLPGLLTSFMHYSRKEKLLLIGPFGIAKYVNTSLELSQSYLDFELEIQEYDPAHSQIIFEDDAIFIRSLPLQHRIPTMGFLIKEKLLEPKLDKAKILFYNLSNEEIKSLVQGLKINTEKGELSLSNIVHADQNLAASYAFVSDTKYTEALLPYVMHTTVIYHETTYLHELASVAAERYHSTSVEAAKFATGASAKMLITGHYSSRYKDLDPFYIECTAYFDNTAIGIDGMRVDIRKARVLEE